MRLFKHLNHHPHGPHHGRRFARGPQGAPHHDRHGPFDGGPRSRRLARFLEHGDLKMLVLHLISEQPRHGYEIIKAIEDLTGGAYAPSPGVVYPTLTLLEELGHVVSTADGSRKSFAITDAGSAALAENKAEVETILARIAKAQTRQSAPAIIRAIENFRMSLRLKLGGEPLSPDAVKALASLLDETARKIEEI